MYTPDQWNAVLAPAIGWKDAYSAVQEQARLLLVTTEVKTPLSTTELVAGLYPEALAVTPAAIMVRKRIFKALMALAERGLSDCATRGEPRVHGRQRPGFMGTVRPWLWSAPDPSRIVAPDRCASCGQRLLG